MMMIVMAVRVVTERGNRERQRQKAPLQSNKTKQDKIQCKALVTIAVMPPPVASSRASPSRGLRSIKSITVATDAPVPPVPAPIAAVPSPSFDCGEYNARLLPTCFQARSHLCD